MKLFQVLRLASTAYGTIGGLWDIDPMSPEHRKFLCFTLEDPYHPQKIKGETRIPAGKYELTLRTEGGFHQKYAKRWPAMHKGMIWVRNVPGYEYILIHVGNTKKDTEGCLLVGLSAYFHPDTVGVTDSTAAYLHVYPIIRDAILAGPTFLEYVDLG